MQANKVPQKTPSFKIPQNVDVFYPETEREDLVKCLELNGFLRLCARISNVSEPTIKKYALPGGKGQKNKVDAVVSFVKEFKLKSVA